MLYLVTGMPGNGKTLYGVDWLMKQIEADAALVKQTGSAPREFYSDIEGLKVEAIGVQTGYTVHPAPDDWREVPDGAVILYDESHRRFPSTGKPGRAEDPRIRDMDTHRHRGIDMMFITQWPSKVHHELRSLVGEHVHLHRAMGMERAGLFRWGRVQLDPYDEKEREKAEEEIWPFPKERYPLYKSTTLHTTSHKFKFPKKIKNGLITGATLVAMAAAFFYFMDFDTSAITGKKQAPEQKAVGSAVPAYPLTVSQFNEQETLDGEVPLLVGTGAYNWINTQPAPTLAGCVASDRGCRCFGSDGFQIDMHETQCRAVLKDPLPFNVYHEYKALAETNTRAKEDKRGAGDSPADAAPPGAILTAGQTTPYGGIAVPTSGAAP